jgi:hypothetical protein
MSRGNQKIGLWECCRHLRLNFRRVFLYMSRIWFHHFTSILPQVPALCLTRKTDVLNSWKMQQDSSFAIRNHFNHQ